MQKDKMNQCTSAIETIEMHRFDCYAHTSSHINFISLCYAVCTFFVWIVVFDAVQVNVKLRFLHLTTKPKKRVGLDV